MNIIGHKNIFLSVSGLFVFASIVVLAFWGLKPGIDFTGGSLLEAEFAGTRPGVQEIHDSLAPLDLGNIQIQPTGERGVILRFRDVDEETHQSVLRLLSGSTGGEGGLIAKRFDAIGPTIGRELRRNSLIALGTAIAAIILYIAFAFRQVSKPVSSWKYGVAAVIALVHDVTIPSGIFAALGHFRGVEVDTLFITALLTILGFSVHDTIVVFDRIRENLRKLKSAEDFEITVNKSVNETIARSVNTSLTVLLVLGAIFVFGGESTKYFSLVLMLGILFGTYSSIFVASPLLVIWQRFGAKKGK